MLNRRAVLLYGMYSESPKGIGDDVAGFDYAPYSQVFPRALSVVHQGGVGTTGQALRAGVPQLIVPFAHDQPDNAARCRRLGAAEILTRDNYNTKNAARELQRLIGDRKYRDRAIETSKIVNSESGTETACDAIEAVLCN